MKKKSLFALFFALIALILEMTPWGAVLRFGNPDGDPFRKTYSYFSLVPYGYAQFFPLLTAVLTVLLVLFLLFSLVKKSEKLENTAFYLSFGSAILSLLPLLKGIENFSLTGAGISLSLVLCAVLLFQKDRLK